MLLPVEANEGTEESQEVLTPWSGRAVYLEIGGRSYTSPFSLSLASIWFQGMVNEGVFDRLREEFFPQIKVSFKVLDNWIIYLSTEKVRLDDLVAYYNLSTIYATLKLMEREPIYLLQQDDEKRKSILNKIKGVLYDIHHKSCSGDIGEPAMTKYGEEEEEFPLYVVLQKPGCSSIRLFILKTAIANIPRYVRFDMLCSREEWNKRLFDENKQLFERLDFGKAYRSSRLSERFPNYELHPVLDELSFEEFYLALKGLFIELVDVEAYPTGSATRAEKDYTLEEIEKMLLSDQW